VNTKSEVLKLLESKRGEYISGSDMAEKLGISRNAVSKAVSRLAEDGYEISAVKKSGYKLGTDFDSLSAEGVLSLLGPSKYKITCEKTVDSTNSVLKSAAVNGACDHTVLIAEHQSSGRGRMGRDYYSPQGTGVYMSVLLRPKLKAEEALTLTTSASVAVALALDQFASDDVKIKWVNDIYIKDKKVCGILTEASVNCENGLLEYAVVGIGINILPPRGGFPAEIEDKAGSVLSEYMPNIRNRIAASVLLHLDKVLNEYSSADILKEYRERSWLDGKRVDVIAGDNVYPASVIGIDDDMRLLVKTDSGNIKQISSGEVSVKTI
jgi:BirA family biotin operon repressor/biotin-[acetyl-CoA-carboxylase] ligase